MAEGPDAKNRESKEQESDGPEPTGQAKPPARPRKPRAKKPAATSAVPTPTPTPVPPAPSPEPEAARPVIDPEHPSPGQPEPPGDPGKTCANCGTVLAGPYCHQCGQQGHLHNKLGHLLHEFVEGIAHFDGRLWRTLPLLAWRPGRLSRDWIEGKRARYVAPLHIFLFALFLMFTIPTFIHYPSNVTVNGVKVGHGDEARELLLEQQRQSLEVMKAEPDEQASRADRFAENAVGFILKKAERSDYYLLKIKSLLYKFGFLMVPISVAILWLLLLYKRGYSLYDHATVALYGLGFTALLVAVSELLPPGLSEWWVFLGMLFVPVHVVRHLKVAYAMGWPAAIGLGLVMGVLTLIGLLLFIVGVAAVGLLG